LKRKIQNKFNYLKLNFLS